DRPGRSPGGGRGPLGERGAPPRRAAAGGLRPRRRAQRGGAPPHAPGAEPHRRRPQGGGEAPRRHLPILPLPPRQARARAGRARRRRRLTAEGAAPLTFFGERGADGHEFGLRSGVEVRGMTRADRRGVTFVRRARSRGFTLVELLVAVAMIGVLS